MFEDARMNVLDRMQKLLHIAAMTAAAHVLLSLVASDACTGVVSGAIIAPLKTWISETHSVTVTAVEQNTDKTGETG